MTTACGFEYMPGRRSRNDYFRTHTTLCLALSGSRKGYGLKLRKSEPDTVHFDEYIPDVLQYPEGLWPQKVAPTAQRIG